jgi:hypothetical protein
MAVYSGIDWSVAKHDVCVLNENGGVIATTILPIPQMAFSSLRRYATNLALLPLSVS